MSIKKLMLDEAKDATNRTWIISVCNCLYRKIELMIQGEMARTQPSKLTLNYTIARTTIIESQSRGT